MNYFKIIEKIKKISNQNDIDINLISISDLLSICKKSNKLFKKIDTYRIWNINCLDENNEYKCYSISGKYNILQWCFFILLDEYPTIHYIQQKNQIENFIKKIE